MSLTLEKIGENWDSLIEFISFLSPERKDILTKFYEQNMERISTMPASSNIAYHNAFPGGYVDHVLRVTKLSVKFKKIWEAAEANIDFTDEELIFSALNHDLGKLGDEKHDLYIPTSEAWLIKKGSIYQNNPSLAYMKVDDRSLFILQSLGLKLTQNEFLAIKLHDGLYEESNKSYYISYNEDYRLRTNLPYILHQADLTAARIEYDLYHKKN